MPRPVLRADVQPIGSDDELRAEPGISWRHQSWFATMSKTLRSILANGVSIHFVIGLTLVLTVCAVECFSAEEYGAAVWKCGHRFIRAHKFVNFIGNKESFEPKCALRNAFFACLKSAKTKCCHKHKYAHTEKFRKRLADTLWSTRVCLLGVKKQ